MRAEAAALASIAALPPGDFHDLADRLALLGGASACMEAYHRRMLALTGSARHLRKAEWARRKRDRAASYTRALADRVESVAGVEGRNKFVAFANAYARMGLFKARTRASGSEGDGRRTTLALAPIGLDPRRN